MPVSAKQLTFLSISPSIRNFCGFLRVPHKSQFSRFKSEYLDDLNDFFHNLVDKTDDISKKINPFLSSILITDTTGFEAYVTENNPKFYQSELKKSKSHAKYFKKNNPDSVFDVEKYAQGQMPKHALSNDLRPQDVKDSFDAKSLIPALETHLSFHTDF